MILNPTVLDLRRSLVMGILNVTPDSFYADSRTFCREQVMERVAAFVAEGADIIDIGGYSSRPGAEDVGLEEEWRRVSMALDVVASIDRGVVISIDTFRAEIVRRAVAEYGTIIVNDISAGEADEDMLAVVAEHKLYYVAMHMRGVPSTMSQLTQYDGGVVRGVVEYFEQRIDEILAAGVAKERLILDPGFGFAKSVEQNWELLASLDALRELGYPILVGVSRKSMIYKPLGISAEESVAGSLALAWEALRGGSAILRVHDVAPTRQIVELANYYKQYRG